MSEQPLFKLTFGDLKAAARITRTREVLVRENFFPAKHFDPADYAREFTQAHRLADGSATDATRPTLGQTGQPFARNAPAAALDQIEQLSIPDPRLVSQRLLHGDGQAQQLAPGINLLCAAWIQFQVHDWFNHDTDEDAVISLPGSETFSALRMAQTRTYGTMYDGAAPSFANTQGHWWDGSQLYGTSETVSQYLRERDNAEGLLRAELRLQEDLLPFEAPLHEHGVDAEQAELSGFIQNWWIGLSVLHCLFAKEHNAIVSRLREAEEGGEQLDGQALEDWLFQKARLINTALMAKIHTIDWTPALLDTPVMKIGLYADWWGQGTEDAGRLFELFARYAQANQRGDDDLLTVADLEAIKQFPGVPAPLLDTLINLLKDGRIPDRLTPAHAEQGPDHQPLDYAMSEEFVSVYRMHSLLRDPVPLYAADGTVHERPLTEVSLANTRAVMQQYGLQGVLHSLVRCAPAALRLRNFPASLSHFQQLGDEAAVDLGAIDIWRDRERRVPRYAAFKAHISQQRGPAWDDAAAGSIRSFTDICGDPEEAGIDAAEQARRRRDITLLAQVYGTPDEVDLQVGLLCEPLPAGFGFSWTAFEVFLLMAIYRLSVDRFFTTDYGPEVYTETGIEWINANTMRSVLQRHFPQLTADHLRELDADGLPANPFCYENWY